MTDRAINFTATEVRATLGQRKLMVRVLPRSPVAKLGPRDRLWVRESCCAAVSGDGRRGVQYIADDMGKLIPDLFEYDRKWEKLHSYRGGEGLVVPSIHMPRWASRLTLTVEDVVEERLQEISERDAIDEGLERNGGRWSVDTLPNHWNEDPRLVYRALWDSLHAKEGERWDDNPLVVAVSFSAALVGIGE